VEPLKENYKKLSYYFVIILFKKKKGKRKMDNIVYNEPMYFSRENKLVKELIFEEGVISCRDNFPASYIRQCLERFTDGYVIIGNRAQIGKQYRSRYFLKGYYIFFYDDYVRTLEGLVFFVKERGIGYQLLNAVKDFAYDNRVILWNGRSLPSEKLIQYYERFGFVRDEMVYDTQGNPKVMKMHMRLTYPRNEATETREEDVDNMEESEDSDI
jgi:GNAT superfamily N-acetyltransferase